MNAQKATVVTLILLLVVPVWASPISLGSVSRSRAATVRGTILVPGSTIFSGDTIEVGDQGSVWIALRGGGQVHVLQNSSVRLIKTTDSIQLTIDRGRAQTTGEVAVINNVRAGNSALLQGTREDRNAEKDKDKDCHVSKHKQKDKDCDRN
jgi:hypothetical protein